MKHVQRRTEARPSLGRELTETTEYKTWLTELTTLGAFNIYNEIHLERQRQDEKWGEQNHPNGTGSALIIPIDPRGMAKDVADRARERCDRLAAAGQVTFEAILTEEIFEAYAEDLPEKLREELVQCGAVIVAWIQKIDRDKRKKSTA